MAFLDYVYGASQASQVDTVLILFKSYRIDFVQKYLFTTDLQVQRAAASFGLCVCAKHFYLNYTRYKCYLLGHWPIYYVKVSF